MIDPDDIEEGDDIEEDYSNLDDLPPMLVRVEPEPFASVPVERPPATLAVERMAADLAGALRSAHRILADALDKVPPADRQAVIARALPATVDLLDVIERLAVKRALRIVPPGVMRDREAAARPPYVRPHKPLAASHFGALPPRSAWISSDIRAVSLFFQNMIDDPEWLGFQRDRARRRAASIAFLSESDRQWFRPGVLYPTG